MNLVNPLILVDGTQYLFRAFNALPEMRTSRGFPTHAIRGVVMMLRKLVRDNPTATVVVIFDGPGKTFRDEMYADYKANRPPIDEDLRVQFDPVYEFVDAMGLPRLEIADVEADDVIGTLATQATAAKRDTLISSSDKDLAQLVSGHVYLQDTMSDSTLDPDGVCEKFEVKPEQIVDYLALMGDKVDNIPGIPGVGKKTAAKWLQTHGDLETIIATADEVKGKVGEKLRAHLDQLPLAQRLATIKCDVNMEHSVDNLAHKPMDLPELLELCQKYEFRQLRDQFNEEAGVEAETPDRVESAINIDVVETVEQLDDVVNEVTQSVTFSVFVVASNHTILDHTVHGLSLSVDGNRVWYVPCGSSLTEPTLSADEALSKLRDVLEDSALTLVTHDAKSLRHVLRSFNLEVKTNVEDIMLMSYVLNSIGHGEHRLKGIAGTVLDRTIMDSTDLLGSGAKRIGFDAADPQAVREYASEQVSTIHALYHEMSTRLDEIDTLRSIYADVEIPLEPLLWEMEHHGTLVDPEVLESLRTELEARKDLLIERAYELAGHEFNLGSPKQLEVVLYDEMLLPAPRASKSGSRSTKEEVLNGLTEQHELPQVILDYRATTKLISTYIAGLSREINPTTKRIHTSYSQANASTGRLASVNPNLQNIPIRTADGRRVREAFIAPVNHVLLTADYSQIELRVMAHLTDDPGLSEAFMNRVDIHQATAAEVFEVTLDSVSEEQRRSAKAINFGLMYGMSAFGLARNLEIPQYQAKEYIEAYFNRYPNVQDYVQATKAYGKENGYVETIYGRRIYLRDINARNPMVRQAAERLAINAPVQGSAADIIKKATICVGEWLRESDLDIMMILQVHDELVFEVADTAVEEARAQIPELMRTAVELSVPLEVDLGIARNWSAAH